MLPFITITPEEFRDYLEQQKPYSMVGQAGTPERCPIQRAVEAKYKDLANDIVCLEVLDGHIDLTDQKGAWIKYLVVGEGESRKSYLDATLFVFIGILDRTYRENWVRREDTLLALDRAEERITDEQYCAKVCELAQPLVC